MNPKILSCNMDIDVRVMEDPNFMPRAGSDLYRHMAGSLIGIVLEALGFKNSSLDAEERKMVIEGADIKSSFRKLVQIWTLRVGRIEVLYWVFTNISMETEALDISPLGSPRHHGLITGTRRVSIECYVFNDLGTLYRFIDTKGCPSRFTLSPGCPIDEMEVTEANGMNIQQIN